MSTMDKQGGEMHEEAGQEKKKNVRWGRAGRRHLLSTWQATRAWPQSDASRACVVQGRLLGLVIDVSGSMMERKLCGNNMIEWLSSATRDSLLLQMKDADRMMLVTINSRVHVYATNGDIFCPELKVGEDSNWSKKMEFFSKDDNFLFNRIQAFNIMTNFSSEDRQNVCPWRGVPGPTGTRMHLGISTIATMMHSNMDPFESGILTWMTDGESEKDVAFIAKSVEMIDMVTKEGVMPIGLVAENDDTILDNFCKSIGVGSNTALRCLHEPRKLSMSIKELIKNGMIELENVVSSDDFRAGGMKRQRSLSIAAAAALPPFLRQDSIAPPGMERTDTMMIPEFAPGLMVMPDFAPGFAPPALVRQ